VEAALGGHLDGGSLKCSTCHDAHQADTPPDTGRGTQRTSPVSKTVNAGGSGTVAVSNVPPGLPAKSYVVQITANGPVGTAEVRVSNDGKGSWMQSGVLTDAIVTLDDGVELAFGGGSFVAPEEYTFHVAYPFLRADNTAGRMCVTCHKDRHMYWQDLEGRADGRLGSGIVLGTTVFSHPVGQPLNANERGYDREDDMLDANGADQATVGDGNPANDLVIDGTGVVTCVSCHRVHNAKSNSLP
jgi:hypothetical protein